MRKRWLVFGVLCLVAAAPALAIFGLGDVVFDPSNFEEAVQQLAQMEQQYLQLVQTYQMVQNQYNQMLQMARQLPASVTNQYRTPVTPWVSSQSRNTYGNSAAWSAGVNAGIDVGSAYSSATQPLNDYGSAWNNIPSDQTANVRTDYATIELTDAANLAAMQTLGQIRANASQTELAIQHLENDSLSADPGLNSEIAVLNKINAAHMIGLRTQENANQLLSALTEEALIQAKRERDAEARSVNQHIQLMTDGRSMMAAQAAGASDAMMTWRMP